MTKTVKPWIIGIGALLIISAFLRLYQLPARLMFLGDQGRDVLIAYKILQGDLTFIGPMTSVGNFYLGPFYYYFVAFWLLIFNLSPIGPAVGIVLFNLISIALLYLLIIKITKSHQIAFFSSLLYAVSPVVIEYSRFSWNPNLLPFMSLLFFYLNYQLLTTPKPSFKLTALLGLTYGLIIQLHYLAGLVIILPVIFVFHRFKKTRTTLWHLVTLFFATFITQLPFLLFEIKHNFREVLNLLNSINPNASTNLITLNPKAILYQIKNLLFLFSLNYFVFYPVFLVASFVILKTLKPKKLLVFFTLITFLSLSIYQGPLYDHYLAFAYFLPALTLALVWNHFKTHKLIFQSILALTIISILFNFYQTYNRIFKYPPNYQLQTTQQVAHLIIKESYNQPFNLALIADNNYADGYKFFLYKQNAPLKTIHQQLTNQLFVICEKPSHECQPLGNPLWDIAAFGWAKIDKTYQVNYTTVFKLVHTKKPNN